MSSKAKQAKVDRDRLHQGVRQVSRRHAERLSATHPRTTPGQEWVATTYPSAAQLTAPKAEASRLPAAQCQFAKAEETERCWTTLKINESSILNAAERLKKELPNHPGCCDHRELEVERDTLRVDFALSPEEVEADLECLGPVCESVHKKQVTVDGELKPRTASGRSRVSLTGDQGSDGCVRNA